jgi:hypothetical protein
MTPVSMPHRQPLRTIKRQPDVARGPMLTSGRFLSLTENSDGARTGRMIWRLVWDGNDSKAGRKRYARAFQSEEYEHICRVLRVGRTYVQFNLFRD